MVMTKNRDIEQKLLYIQYMMMAENGFANTC